MKPSKKIIFAASLLAVIFSLFLDKAAFSLVSYIKNPVFDLFFGLITSPYAMALILLLGTFLLYSDKRNRRSVPFLWASFILSMLFAFALKLIVSRLRPSGEMFYAVLNMPSYSFPSMHAMAAFSIVPLLAVKLPKLKWLWISFAFLFSFSRLYLGLHFLSDLAAGAFLAYFIGMFMVYLGNNKANLYNYEKVKRILGEFESKRKIFHIAMGLLLVLLLKFGILGWLGLLFLAVSAAICSVISRKYPIPIIHDILNLLEREEDIKAFPAKGLVFYLAGAFLVVAFFPRDIALASIMVLALGDSVSHIFGSKFGRIYHPLTNKKFLEGMIAGIIAGFLGALFFVSWHEALIAALFAMFAEGIEIKVGAEEVDDNLVVPLAAAVSIWAVRLIL